MLYLAAAIMFTWRLYYGALEMRQIAEVIAAFDFYRWWTIPFDLFCMIVLILAIVYTLAQDLAAARTGAAPSRPVAEAERHERSGHRRPGVCRASSCLIALRVPIGVAMIAVGMVGYVTIAGTDRLAELPQDRDRIGGSARSISRSFRCF